MKVFEHVELECAFCDRERPHALLYLSEQMRASRCEVCERVLVFSGPLQEEHAIDIFRRTLHLPGKLSNDLFSRPLSPLTWPVKALRKPFLVLREARKVEQFQRRSRAPLYGRCGEDKGPRFQRSRDLGEERQEV